VVECTALEMRHTGNRIGGSNPSLSANDTSKHLININSFHGTELHPTFNPTFRVVMRNVFFVAK
jgi:hypothetical protein